MNGFLITQELAWKMDLSIRKTKGTYLQT